MTAVMVTGFRHRPSGSCLVAALRDLYEHAGFRLSEELVFGLGSGLFFGYGGYLETRSFSAAVQPPALEVSLCANTGVRFRHYHLEDDEAAWRRLALLLSRGSAVAVQLNPLYCGDLMQRLDERLVPYVPPHWVTAHGYDLGRGLVSFYENGRFDSRSMRIDEFKRGRNSGRDTQNPMNTWLELEFPASLVPIGTAARLAIRQTVYAFKRIEAIHTRSGVGFYVGLEGLKRFGRQLRTWPRIMSAAEIRDNALRMKCSLTIAGGARDALRGLYSRFLTAVGALIETPRLVAIGGQYRALAALWQRLDGLLSVIADRPEDPRHWSDGAPYPVLLSAIVRGEQAAIDEMERLVAHWDATAEGKGSGALQEVRT